MKVAISTSHNVVAAVFDFSDEIVICECLKNKRFHKVRYVFSADNLPERVQFLANMSISHVICGSISNVGLKLLEHHDVVVVQGVKGKINEVLVHFSNNCLNRNHFLLPGYQKKRCNK